MRDLAASLVLVVSLSPIAARAQDACDATCDVVVDMGARDVGGTGIAAGATICLRGGTTSSLTIHDVHGTEAAPITIRACDSPLELGGGTGAAITIRTSSHLRVTGGDARAIRIDGGDVTTNGVSVANCTEHLEMDRLEVSGVTYTAYRNLSEDDACAVRTGFSVHDWFIHDVGGVGMFFGLNADSPYRIAGVDVFRNRVERTGTQGIKIGRTVDDARVLENVVIDAGLRDVPAEDTGITGGAGSFFIERNVVLRTSASCVFATGHDLHIVDNLLVGCGGAGISTNGMTPMQIRILHNTIVAVGERAAHVYSSMPEESAFTNNLVVDLPAGQTLGVSAGGAWAFEGNLTLSASEAAFARAIDPATATYEDLVPPPFALSAASPAHDTGVGTDGEVTIDLVGTPRDSTPDVGALEIEAAPSDAGHAETPDAAVVSEADAGASVATDGGVRSDASTRADAASSPSLASTGGCNVGSRPGSRWVWLVLALAMLVLRSRRA